MTERPWVGANFVFSLGLTIKRVALIAFHFFSDSAATFFSPLKQGAQLQHRTATVDPLAVEGEDDSLIIRTCPAYQGQHVINTHLPTASMQAFEKFLRGVFDMAVMDGVAFERCHEVMKALADSWQNMKSIPARCGIEEAFEVRRADCCGAGATFSRVSHRVHACIVVFTRVTAVAS